jgi:hypothetical protein
MSRREFTLLYEQGIAPPSTWATRSGNALVTTLFIIPASRDQSLITFKI